jgi:hypothetical protein
MRVKFFKFSIVFNWNSIRHVFHVQNLLPPSKNTPICFRQTFIFLQEQLRHTEQHHHEWIEYEYSIQVSHQVTV